MKIVAIVSSQTNEEQTAFKTDPPLTEEVMEGAFDHYFGQKWRNVYSEARGLFIVARTAVPKDEIQNCEKTLTDAENLIQKRKASAKSVRDEFLKAQSNSTGLPVE